MALGVEVHQLCHKVGCSSDDQIYLHCRSNSWKQLLWDAAHQVEMKRHLRSLVHFLNRLMIRELLFVSCFFCSTESASFWLCTPVMTEFTSYIVPIPESSSCWDAANLVEMKRHLRSPVSPPLFINFWEFFYQFPLILFSIFKLFYAVEVWFNLMVQTGLKL